MGPLRTSYFEYTMLTGFHMNCVWKQLSIFQTYTHDILFIDQIRMEIGNKEEYSHIVRPTIAEQCKRPHFNSFANGSTYSE